MRRKQAWVAGDCFGIPLSDERLVLGQILAHEPRVLNSVSCALFSQIVELGTKPEPDLECLFSVLFITRDLLDSGAWQVLGNRPVGIARDLFPYEALRALGFIGAKISGSGIVNEFVDAFHGLSFWDDWANPSYLDNLLISPAKKPEGLLYKAEPGNLGS